MTVEDAFLFFPSFTRQRLQVSLFSAIIVIILSQSSLHKHITEKTIDDDSLSGIMPQRENTFDYSTNKNSISSRTNNNNNNVNHVQTRVIEEDKIGITEKDTNNTDNNDIHNKSTSSSSRIHIVFSTACTKFQHWQSYIMFYQAWKIGQVGEITRIVSGCSMTQEEKLKALHKTQIVDVMKTSTNQLKYHIHFTPEFTHKGYHFFNKAFGLRNWMENGPFHYGSRIIHTTEYDDVVVILLDPDQILLRPFTNDFSNLPGFTDGTSSKIVQHGSPFGQLWTHYWTTEYLPSLDMDKIVTKTSELPSPVNNITKQQAKDKYTVGPPYIATAKDMYQIAVKWTEFAPQVFDVLPGHMTEMHAYVVAVAHLQLPHESSNSFMISNYAAIDGNENWSFVDQLADDNTDMCLPNFLSYTSSSSSFVSHESLPYTFHYCQRWMLGKWFFNKHVFPKDFLFTCNSPLLKVPPKNISLEYDFGIARDGTVEYYRTPKKRKRVAFMLCQLIHKLNEVATFYKNNHCSSNDTSYDKSYTFHENMEIEYEHLDNPLLPKSMQ